MKLKNFVFVFVLFLVFFSFSSNSFASEYKSAAEEVFNSFDSTYKEYVVIKQDDGSSILFILNSSSFDFSSVPSSQLVQINPDYVRFQFLYPGYSYYVATYIYDTSTNKFKHNNNKVVNETTYSSVRHNCVSVEDSTIDIYRVDGSLFFQLTPTLAEVITQGVQTMALQVVGAMKILVVCGVGLIALLAVLGVFGKVFRIFQVK